MAKVIDQGIYAGLPYIVTEKDGKIYIGLQGEQAAALAAAGANMKLLNNIGDQDAEEVMAAFVQTIPQQDQ